MTMGRPFKCPKCESSETIWKGHRRTRLGRTHLRKCKKCGRKFTTNHQIPYTPDVSVPPELIPTTPDPPTPEPDEDHPVGEFP